MSEAERKVGFHAGDQHGNIRVWDLTANACSCELVPEVGTPVRSLTVAQDASLVIAANNQGWQLASACLKYPFHGCEVFRLLPLT